MSFQVEFGKMVRQEREARGMKQIQLAKCADIELRHIYNIENGLVEPKLRIIIVFADILKLDLNELKQYAAHDADGIYWKSFDSDIRKNGGT